MSWYRSGTIAVTNGSTTVTGTGTAFVGAVQPGWGLAAPDGRLYEIAAVVSATGLTLATPYLGSTGSGQAYAAFPTRGEIAPFVSQLQSLLGTVQATVDGAGAGKFANGTAATPGLRFAADEDTGIIRSGANVLGFVTGGVQRALLSTTSMTSTVPLHGPDGSAAFPGLSFVNNVNMGLYREAAGQMGFAVTGVRRALMTGTTFQLDLPMSGTAVTQTAIDTTAGRITKVGDFGLGTNSPTTLADLDSFTTPNGLYLANNAVTLGTFPPTSTVGEVVLVMRPTANQITQILSNPNSAGQMWHRRSNSTTGWGPWRRFYDTSNILGTVAQSAGVPTGAVIERSNNANGAYIRFADGTQICWHALTVADISAALGAVFRSPSVVWTFPAEFSGGVGTVTSACNADSRWTGRGESGASNTSASFRALSATTTATSVVVLVMAIGRWF